MNINSTNPQPIHTARDADLRRSQQALERAALRARELARQTGTAIVVSNHGKLEFLLGETDTQALSAQEPAAPYRVQP